MRLTIKRNLHFYFFTLSKGTDDAQSFLGYVLSTKFLFPIWFSSASRAHPSWEGLWWTEGSCRGVSIFQYGKRTSTRTSRTHLRGLGNQCSSAVYNQRRLTIELIRQTHDRPLEKANENVANQRKHKFYKRWRHEIRHRDPRVKITPGLLPFNLALPHCHSNRAKV